MHFLQKEHNLNKELCSTFMRNVTIHMLLDILLLASGHFLLESKGNLPSWTNQQAPCPLAQLPAGFIQWETPVADGRRTGSGIWLPPPSCCRLAKILHLQPQLLGAGCCFFSFFFFFFYYLLLFFFYITILYWFCYTST